MENTALLMLTLLIVKHFIIDFPLQTPYQYLNKGTYGHPGGILHSVYHIVGTILVIGLFVNIDMLTNEKLVVVAVAEGVIHYHIDWAKVHICKATNWKCNTSDYYWWMLGLDQFLHYMTYVLMTWIYLNSSI